MRLMFVFLLKEGRHAGEASDDDDAKNSSYADDDADTNGFGHDLTRRRKFTGMGSLDNCV